MISPKLNLVVICGGKSAEHEISLLSAINILKSCDRKKYQVFLIGITKEGIWNHYQEQTAFKNADNPKKISLTNPIDQIAIVPDNPKGYMVELSRLKQKIEIDVVFPILHGTFGEDGSMQGLLSIARLPFVGADVIGSAIGMDKEVMKRLLQHAHIAVTPYVVFQKEEKKNISFQNVTQRLKLPLFVKPANTGSSVGISRVFTQKEFDQAVELAFQFDQKILIEQGVQGREIECSVLGNANPKASIPGEICPKDHFYSYEAKYIDDDGAKLLIPAPLSPELTKQVQETAVKAYQTLCCKGFARVDMFLTPEETVLINEINTLPGFTNISMYPKLWELSGISQTELIDQLINLALERK